jgi:hypothetical protein
MERKFQGDRRIEDGGLCILFWLPSSLKLRRDKTPQNIEAPINANNIVRITKTGFVVKIFMPGLQLQASLSPPVADRYYSSNALSFYILFIFDDSD